LSDKCWISSERLPALWLAKTAHNATGGTLGGQLGYRWQSTNWVLDAARRVLQRIAS